MAEIDKGFAGYSDMVKRRTNLKDRHVAEGYMRGQGGDAHMRPEDLPRVAGLTDLHILLDEANLSIGVDVSDLDTMIVEWQRQVDAQEMDPRVFTRRFLHEGMLLNRHREDDGSTDLMLAAFWLAATGPQGAITLPLLKRGDCGFYTKITVEEGKGVRVQSWIDDYKNSAAKGT